MKASPCQVRTGSRCHLRTHTTTLRPPKTLTLLHAHPGCLLKTTGASTGRLAHPLLLLTLFSDSLCHRPNRTWKVRSRTASHHDRDEGLRIWHLFESDQHCGAQHVVVGSNPVDTQDCSPRSASVAALSKCPTQSVPALVERTGMARHSFSKSLANCFASVLAVRRRREHPVAMPRTHPSFFVNAVNLAEVSAFEILAGMRACAKLVTASKSNSKRSVSSNSTFRCS